ncbi:MAG: serine--tRNA ligase [Thermodesulfobacteriota bacterium]
MLDSKLIEENMLEVKRKLDSRGAKVDYDQFRALDLGRKEMIKKVEELERERNVGSKKMGELMRDGKKEEAGVLQEEMKEISSKIKNFGELRTKAEDEFRNFMLMIPNVPNDSVPIGKNEEDNVEIRKWGEPREFDFTPKDHIEIGRDLDILDLDRAAKITGARFALYKGLGARLERALINFMLDLHTNDNGYTEVLPPFMANTDSFIGTGNLPKFEEDLFKIQDSNFYLIPTAEVPVTNIHRDEILKEEDLPIKYVAYTPCFRSEAGSYVKDVKGIIRQHQFNKVELVKFSTPEKSYEEHESLTQNAERILQLLGLPYRVVVLCTGDMGFSSAKTYDLEVWVPSENTYREISSCSNFEDFQARRASIRYRPKEGGKTKLVHTLNGSGLAVGRTFLGILENYQQSDGSVTIPEVLVPYMGGIKEISN